MKELQRKQKTRRILYSLPSLIIIFIIAIFLGRAAFSIMTKERESSFILDELRAKSSSLTLREQELKEGISYLGTNEGIEDEIRDKYSVIQDGEHVAIVVDEKKTASTTEIGSLPWYKKLWTAIIGDK